MFATETLAVRVLSVPSARPAERVSDLSTTQFSALLKVLRLQRHAHSRSKERKSTPLFSCACARFCRNGGWCKTAMRGNDLRAKKHALFLEEHNRQPQRNRGVNARRPENQRHIAPMIGSRNNLLADQTRVQHRNQREARIQFDAG